MNTSTLLAPGAPKLESGAYRMRDGRVVGVEIKQLPHGRALLLVDGAANLWEVSAAQLARVAAGWARFVLRVAPASRADVARFVTEVHRHHDAPVGDVFRLALVDDTGAVRGVASVGRPVAPKLDDGWTLEVNRVATDGVHNGCSLLYGACRRIAWTMGYRRMVTYTLPEEGGASLRAAGWTCDGEVGRSKMGWSSRPGRRDVVLPEKTRWSCANSAASQVETAWPWPEAESPQLALWESE